MHSNAFVQALLHTKDLAETTMSAIQARPRAPRTDHVLSKGNCPDSTFHAGDLNSERSPATSMSTHPSSIFKNRLSAEWLGTRQDWAFDRSFIHQSWKRDKLHRHHNIVANLHTSQQTMSPTSPAAIRSLPDVTDSALKHAPSIAAAKSSIVSGAVSRQLRISSLEHLSSPVQQQPSLREWKSNASHTLLSRGRQTSKKKSSRLLAFLRLKEPSTSAFENFADQERKRIAQKDSSRSGGVGASCQRLPDYVPKVNSKWNGLPEQLKARRRKSDDLGYKEMVNSARSPVSSHGSTTKPNERR